MSNVKEFIGTVFMIVFMSLYLFSAIYNSIEQIVTIVDTVQNGFIPLREGYIPPSKRKVDGVKFVPDGEDPSDYIIP